MRILVPLFLLQVGNDVVKLKFFYFCQVTVGRMPVTGMRLFLEGKKCNRLASVFSTLVSPIYNCHILSLFINLDDELNIHFKFIFA